MILCVSTTATTTYRYLYRTGADPVHHVLLFYLGGGDRNHILVPIHAYKQTNPRHRPLCRSVGHISKNTLKTLDVNPRM